MDWVLGLLRRGGVESKCLGWGGGFDVIFLFLDMKLSLGIYDGVECVVGVVNVDLRGENFKKIKMPKDKRQIILGAGSSKNAEGSGYPLGCQLLEIICDLCDNIKPQDYPENGDLATAMKEFAQNLKNNSYTSVDTYIARLSEQDDTVKQCHDKGLMHNTSDFSYSKIGCCLIAEILKSYGHQKIQWYGNLLPLIFPISNPKDSIDNKIANIKEHIENIEIITFNYDLSLEKFIYDNLKNVYIKPNLGAGFDNKIKEIFGIICKKIVHVYGSIVVGEDAIYDFVANNYAANNMENYFNNKKNLQEIKDRCRIDGGRAGDQERSKKLQDINQQNIKTIIAKTIALYKSDLSIGIAIIERGGHKIEIKECEYLYIFGFGFDPLNIEQIGLNKSNKWSKQCFVTNFRDNKKNERIIVNYLTNCSEPIRVTSAGGLNTASENIFRLDFPIISILSIEKALDKDFSLVEDVKASEGIVIKVFGKNISSYHAEYRKYLK